MLISRLVAVFFVLAVAAFVGLSTALKDPADTATRLSAELDVESPSMPGVTFDAQADLFLDEGEETLAELRTELSAIVSDFFLAQPEFSLDADTTKSLVSAEVEKQITEADLQPLAMLLSGGRQNVRYAIEQVTSLVVDEDGRSENLSINLIEVGSEIEESDADIPTLSAAQQQLLNFGDSLGEQTIEIILSLQTEDGAFATYIAENELEELTKIYRPRLSRVQRVAYREIAAVSYAPPIEVSGSTAVNRRAQVRARTGSTVAEIFVKAGDTVTAGQVMLTLDRDDRDARRLQALAGIAQAEAGKVQSAANMRAAEAGLNSANAQLNQAETSLADAIEAQDDVVGLGDFASSAQRRGAQSAVDQATQGVNLAQSGIAQAEAAVAQAEAGLAQAEASYQSAEASLAQVDLDIERLEVTAPFAGRVEESMVEIGGAVNPGESLFQIADLSTMVISAFVSDEVRQILSLGNETTARVGSESTGVEAMGPITFIGAASNPQTRTFEIQIEVENWTDEKGQLAIVDNQFATVFFARQAEDLYRIPQSALTSASVGSSGDGETGLFTLNEHGVVVFTPISFADYNEGGELLIATDRIGGAPLRLIVGRGGYVKPGDRVNGRQIHVEADPE